MSEVDWAMIIIMITAVWIGWPLHQIAAHFKTLREMAEKARDRR